MLIYARRFAWIDYPTTAPTVKQRSDPSDPTSALIDVPAPWWRSEYVGFRARILSNPNTGEIHRAASAFRAVLRGNDHALDTLLAELAGRVVAWDVVHIDDDGTRRDVEPPATGGIERFFDLPNDVFVWLRDELMTAHMKPADADPEPVALETAA